MIIPLGITSASATKQMKQYEKLAVAAILINDNKRYTEYNKIANYYKQIAEKLKEREYNKKLKIY